MSLLAAIVVPGGRSPSGWAELVGAAHAAARVTGAPVHALVVGGDAGALGALARETWRLGAERVWVAADPALAEPDPDRYVTALAEAARAIDPSTVLLNGDPFGAQLGPRLAMRIGAATVTEVVEVRTGADGRPAWVRPMYGGKAMAVVTARRPKAVVNVRPRAFAAPAARAGEAPADAVGELKLTEAPGLAPRLRVIERRAAASEGVRLEDARVIVSGGRGMGGPEGFKVLQQLAELLGGAVGASRAAVDAGWVPGHLQIGQTGKMVAPELYLAVGISGASQHLAGISGARHIVAINKDPEAPIFRAAEIGLVDDWRKVLPLLIERLAQALGRQPASQAG